jgi:DNA integrity scanning protein DisA with diadenylate cyclase activity
MDRITESLMQCVRGVASSAGARTVLVYVDPLDDELPEIPDDMADSVVCVTRSARDEEALCARGRRTLRVPAAPLRRLGQVKIAVFLAMVHKLVARGDVVVCLTGPAGGGTLDTMVVTEVGREYEMLSTADAESAFSRGLHPEVVERVISLATALGAEGREGRPVGALFVVGDAARVLSMSRQLTLNPFHGYPEEKRNVLDPSLEETVKEFASIDGAFVVRGDGVVEACGAYLKTASQEEYEMPRGLGARHHAAAGITALTEAAAVTLSESTGNVMVFRSGKAVLEVERPRSGVLPLRKRTGIPQQQPSTGSAQSRRHSGGAERTGAPDGDR